jgi:hypothetical protein
VSDHFHRFISGVRSGRKCSAERLTSGGDTSYDSAAKYSSNYCRTAKVFSICERAVS